MSHIFISYSKKNRAYARVLADHLLSLGFDVWIDDRIDYGEMWERTIFKAIDDCAAFLVIMTPDSYQSDWVLREIQYADRRHKPQFPVLLDGEDFPRYGPHQHVDVRGGILPPEDFYKRLEQAAPLETQTGVNVTPAKVAISPTDTLPKTPTAPSTKPVSGLNTRTMITIGVGLLAAVLVGGLVLLNRQSAGEATIPTPTAQGGGAGQIVFSSDRDGNDEIYVMDADGTDLRRLTNNPALDAEPAWSPDGGQIAFRSDRAGNDEIYVMNADGSNQRNLTQNSADDDEPAWSPDGKQIAFQSSRDGNREVYVMNADGSNQRNLTQNSADDADPAWSLDGKQIAFQSSRDHDLNFEIYVMNADGSNQHHLTQNSASDGDPAWSPDSSQIAFVASPDGNLDIDDIYVMNADGTNVRRLTDNAAKDFSPAWSPDGSQIAFGSYRDTGTQIYVMNADGSNQHNISNISNTLVNGSPAWRPAVPNN